MTKAHNQLIQHVAHEILGIQAGEHAADDQQKDQNGEDQTAPVAAQNQKRGEQELPERQPTGRKGEARRVQHRIAGGIGNPRICTGGNQKSKAIGANHQDQKHHNGCQKSTGTDIQLFPLLFHKKILLLLFFNSIYHNSMQNGTIRKQYLRFFLQARIINRKLAKTN